MVVPPSRAHARMLRAEPGREDAGGRGVGPSPLGWPRPRPPDLEEALFIQSSPPDSALPPGARACVLFPPPPLFDESFPDFHLELPFSFLLVDFSFLILEAEVKNFILAVETWKKKKPDIFLEGLRLSLCSTPLTLEQKPNWTPKDVETVRKKKKNGNLTRRNASTEGKWA